MIKESADNTEGQDVHGVKSVVDDDGKSEVSKDAMNTDTDAARVDAEDKEESRDVLETRHDSSDEHRVQHDDDEGTEDKADEEQKTGSDLDLSSKTGDIRATNSSVAMFWTTRQFWVILYISFNNIFTRPFQVQYSQEPEMLVDILLLGFQVLVGFILGVLMYLQHKKLVQAEKRSTLSDLALRCNFQSEAERLGKELKRQLLVLENETFSHWSNEGPTQEAVTEDIERLQQQIHHDYESVRAIIEPVYDEAQ